MRELARALHSVSACTVFKSTMECGLRYTVFTVKRAMYMGYLVGLNERHLKLFNVVKMLNDRSQNSTTASNTRCF